jgi:hypothetical protein
MAFWTFSVLKSWIPFCKSVFPASYLPHSLHHASSHISLYAITANSADALKILNVLVGKKFTGTSLNV